MIAAEIGNEESALEHFRYALLMDLADVAGNVSDGVHIAAAAGSWMAIVNGFGGVRDYDGRLSLDPHLPRTWRSLEFSLHFRDRQLRIRLGHDEERYTLEAGHALTIRVRDDHHVLRAGEPLVLTRRSFGTTGDVLLALAYLVAWLAPRSCREDSRRSASEVP